MSFASMRIAAALGGALLLAAANGVLAQGGDPKSAPPRPPATEGEKQQKDGQQRKLDEFAEAAKVLGGPAANPECVWLGRRVVSLLWRDDLDTAFRHLDLYDRFGCPAGHIQATFRCLVRRGNIDLKTQETLSGRVHTCWINPNPDADAQDGTTPPSASAPAGSTNR
jgi:hypothetical protein